MSAVRDDGPIERRVTASYLIAFAIVLVTFALAVHAAFVILLERDTSARGGDLLSEARNAIELHDGRRTIDEDTVQLANPRAEGVAWYDARGTRLAAVGAFPGAAAVARGAFAERSEVAAAAPGGPITVRAFLARDAERRELTELDLGLAAGLLVALAAATVGGRMLARRSIERVVTGLRTMREFSADAAHELRGPLAAIASNAGASLRADDALAPAHRSRLQTIADTAKSLGRTVDDLLLLARVDAPIERELFAVDLGERVREAAATRREVASERGIALHVDAHEAAIYGDPAEIDRIAGNLLDNALRYTPRGGTVTVSCAPERAGFLLRVADTGRGIAPEDLPRVFDRFWRGEPARSQAGTGLGLSIVRALARRHGGTVAVRSTLGAGSEFAVWLPARPPRPGLHDF